MTIHHDLLIKSQQGDYPVYIRDSFQALPEALANAKAHIAIIDEHVWSLYSHVLKPHLGSTPYLTISANENTKTLSGVEKILHFMQEHDATTQTTLLTIGGGIIQDLTTFAANVYYRGIKWVLFPTTLLGMSDSCIGAKSGINFGKLKNQLGVFHSPSQIWIFPEFINTLAEQDIKSGYGEIIKLHLIGSLQRFHQIKAEVGNEGLNGPSLVTAIKRSLEVKQQVIQADEHESDLRRILNYGHTFGHALESATSYSVPHGVAIAWGIDCVNCITWQRGLLDQKCFEEIHQFLQHHFSQSISASPPITELLERTKRDKKNRDGLLTLAVLREPGNMQVIQVPFDEELNNNLHIYQSQYTIFHET